MSGVDTGASLQDRAGHERSHSTVSPPIGDHPSRDFLVKRWRVNVVGYGDAFYEERTRGSAMAQAWRCDAFGHLTFGEFLKIARCTRDHDLPDRWGDPITVEGRPAFFLENNRQYVRFAYPGRAAPSNAHPYDVLPVAYRPDTYRDRDSDQNPQGGNEVPSRSDASAVAKPIAQGDAA